MTSWLKPGACIWTPPQRELYLVGCTALASGRVGIRHMMVYECTLSTKPDPLVWPPMLEAKNKSVF
jgi:hypothetical protein